MRHFESIHQKALFNWASNYPALKWMHSSINGAFLAGNKAQRAKRMAVLKSQGAKSGVWDVFLPVAKNGYHGLYIEMKYGRNKLTEKQESFGEFVHSEGYLTHTCYSWLEAKDVISDYMGF